MAKNEKPTYTNILQEPTHTHAHVDENHYLSAIGPPPLPSPRQVPGQNHLPGNYETIDLKHETPTTIPPKAPHKEPKKAKTLRLPSKEIILGICIIVLLAVVVAETTIILTQQKISDNEPLKTAAQTVTPMPAKPTSCLDLKEMGYVSGVYVVTNVAENYDYEVYCDMETDGGGWTLVASVHEDDISRKCDVNDRWSSFSRPDSNNRAYSAWENKQTFGNVRNATSDDYKNEGYYSLQSKDVMIWHVPSETPLETAKNKSSLRYRTTNNFLNRLGGNLYSILTEYYPLNIRQDYEEVTVSEFSQRTGKVMDALEENGDTIKSSIPNWYPYELNYSQSDGYRLYDRGLYEEDGGNRITIYIDSYPQYEGRTISYDDEIWWRYVPHTSTLAKTSRPFMMINVIGNERELLDMFIHTEVFSWHNDYVNHTIFEGNIKPQNIRIHYKGVQIFTNNSATACEFFFIASNDKEWRSIEPGYFGMSPHLYTTYRDTDVVTHGIGVNYIFGYHLLARENGLAFTKQMLDDVATTIIASLKEIPDIFNEFAGTDGFVLPIIFDEGNSDAALAMIPEKLQNGLEGGYLQLRAYNKVDNPLAEYVCIGGISNSTRNDVGTCGDFAGWHGRGDNLGENGRSEYAHSDEDLNSVLLIFYR